MNEWAPEHVVWVEGSQPVAVRVGVVVTSSSAVTLNEGNLPKLFKTRSRRCQRLTRALSSDSSFLQKYERIEPKKPQSGFRLSEQKLFTFTFESELTITKEYPTQSGSQSTGQSGTTLVWLWMAITLALASHTEHLQHQKSFYSFLHPSPLL